MNEMIRRVMIPNEVLCIGAGLLFSASMYLPRDARRSLAAILNLHDAAVTCRSPYDRNSPKSIQDRVLIFATVASGALLIMHREELRSLVELLSAGEFEKLTSLVKDVFLAQAHAAMACARSTFYLFGGVIASRIFDDGDLFHEIQTVWVNLVRPESNRDWWNAFRDFVFCPLGEEIFFRAFMLHLLNFQGVLLPGATNSGQKSNSVSIPYFILVSSLTFSLSHFHHVVRYATEAYRSLFFYSPVAREISRLQHQRCQKGGSEQKAGIGEEQDDAGRTKNIIQGLENLLAREKDLSAREKLRRELKELRSSAWKTAFGNVGAGLLVTFLFGLLSGTQFSLARRSVLATSLSHSFCNLLGPPDLTFLRSKGISRLKKALIGVVYIVGIGLFLHDVKRMFASASHRR